MISVVIPTYNHRDFVLESLESVFAQTYTDYEVIVVNDGSPDDTAERLRPLVEAGRIVYIEQPNAGQGAARNRGIAEAKGEYIALLDDDDRWPPDKLAWQAAELEAHPEAVMVYGDYRRIERDGRMSPPVETYCPSGAVYDAFLRGCRILSPGQTLIRASALRAVGGFDPEVWGSDDWDLYLRLAKQGEFRHVRRVALEYRLHGGNASRHAVRHAENHFKVMLRHMGRDFRLIVPHLREAAPYFVPNLMRAAHDARCHGDYAKALQAYRFALAFRPGLLLHKGYLAGAAGCLLKRPPRTVPAEAATPEAKP